MNLVQIQERLKDAPVQAIMQYANGANPMVPPYLALAELKRRESITQSAQAQQAAQQGQQPSVKDQVEQAAGLAALQQKMQQQGMQNLMQQARPQAIPENIPQPQRQPESEGIAGLPAGDFNFADGGIVAFQGGGSTYDAAKARLNAARNKLNQYGLKLQKSDPQGFEAAKQEVADAERQFAQAKTSWESETASLDRPIMGREDIGAASRFMQQQPVDSGYAAKEAARAAAVAQQPAGIPAALPPKTQQTGAAQATSTPPVSTEPPKFALEGDYQSALQDVMAIKDPTERAQAFQALQQSQQQAPAASQAGIAALPGAQQAQQKMIEAMQTESTPQSAFQKEREMAGLYGLTQPFGEERMQRISQMEAERKRMLEDRGMERLMRVMGGIAARGLQGAGPAYLAAIEGERGSDVAFRKQMDELLGGVEEKRRAEQVAGMQRATTQMGEERRLSLGAAEKIFDAETRRQNEEFRLRLENQLRMMQPNEAAMLQRMIEDKMRRNPNLTLTEAYAEVMEAHQGATPEVQRERIERSREADWNKIMDSPLAMDAYKKMGITNVQQYKDYMAGKSSSSSIPPRPAGAVKEKGVK